MATPTVRDRVVPAPGLSVTSPSSTIAGDLLICFVAERNGAGAADHNPINGFALWGTTALDDASEDGRATVVYKVATTPGAVAYTPVSSTDGSETLTGMVVLVRDSFSVAFLGYEGLAVITTTAPNPPLAVGGADGVNALGFATAFERSGASEANAFTAPSGMGNLIEESANATLHLGVADQTLLNTTAAGLNPGQWTDTIAPTGSVGQTLIIYGPYQFPTIPEVSAAPVTGLSATTTSGILVGDLLICITWERTGAGVPTHTIESGWTSIWTQPHDDASTDGRLSVAYKVATSAGIQAVQGWTSDVGTDCWTGYVAIGKDTYNVNQPVISVLGTTSTSNAAPNSPGANQTNQAGGTPTEPYAVDVTVLSISAWHLAAGATGTVTAGTNYTKLWDVAGSQTSELAVKYRTLATPATNPDPPAWTDDITPNGTSSITVCIQNLPPVSVPKAGMKVILPLVV